MPSYDDYLSSSQKKSSLYFLAQIGDVDAISALLQKGQHDINERDFKGYSPLMYAAYHGHVKLVSFLLQNGADPNSTDFNENTILMGVCFKGHEEIIELLLEAGANPNLRNKQYQSAIDFAHLFGRLKVVEMLSGAKPSFSLVVMKSVSSWMKFLNLVSAKEKCRQTDSDSQS